MSDATAGHYQPKLANKLAENCLNGPPKAEVRGSNPLECAILHSKILQLAECVELINITGSVNLDANYCGFITFHGLF